MSGHSSPVFPGGRRTLPPGGAQRLGQAYLLFTALTAVLLVGAGGLTVAAARSAGRGRSEVLPALLAGSGATVGLLLLAVAALTGRAAISGDLVDRAATTRVIRVVRVVQVVVVSGALAALGYAVLHGPGDDGGFPLWLAVGVGGPVAALALFAGSLARLARVAARPATTD